MQKMSHKCDVMHLFNSRINVMGRFFTCQGIVMGRFVQLSGSQYQGANKILLK